jgi:hypothetical protein
MLETELSTPAAVIKIPPPSAQLLLLVEKSSRILFDRSHLTTFERGTLSHESARRDVFKICVGPKTVVSVSSNARSPFSSTLTVDIFVSLKAMRKFSMSTPGSSAHLRPMDEIKRVEEAGSACDSMPLL